MIAPRTCQAPTNPRHDCAKPRRNKRQYAVFGKQAGDEDRDHGQSKWPDVGTIFLNRVSVITRANVMGVRCFACVPPA